MHMRPPAPPPAPARDLLDAAAASPPAPPAMTGEPDWTARFEAAGPRLYRYLWGMTGDAALAEELLQEARLRAWQARAGLRDAERAEAWLFRIAVNLARQHLRRHRRWRWLSWDHPRAAGIASEPPEPSRRLRWALDALGDEDRSVLLLIGHEGWSAGEVAEATGLSREAVYKRWQRACARFRVAWEEQGE